MAINSIPPLALIFLPKSDHNGAFTKKNPKHELLMHNLKKHYRAEIFRVGSTIEVIDQLQRVHGKASIVLFGGHGRKKDFGNGPEYTLIFDKKDKINGSLYSKNRDALFNALLPKIKRGALCIFRSCDFNMRGKRGLSTPEVGTLKLKSKNVLVIACKKISRGLHFDPTLSPPFWIQGPQGKDITDYLTPENVIREELLDAIQNNEFQNVKQMTAEQMSIEERSSAAKAAIQEENWEMALWLVSNGPTLIDVFSCLHKGIIAYANQHNDLTHIETLFHSNCKERIIKQILQKKHYELMHKIFQLNLSEEIKISIMTAFTAEIVREPTLLPDILKQVSIPLSYGSAVKEVIKKAMRERQMEAIHLLDAVQRHIFSDEIKEDFD